MVVINDGKVAQSPACVLLYHNMCCGDDELDAGCVCDLFLVVHIDCQGPHILLVCAQSPAYVLLYHNICRVAVHGLENGGGDRTILDDCGTAITSGVLCAYSGV